MSALISGTGSSTRALLPSQTVAAIIIALTHGACCGELLREFLLVADADTSCKFAN